MSVLIRKMLPNDKLVWAEMRFKLWDSLPLEEHLGDIDRMLKASKHTGYIAILPDRGHIGFAEISIRDYANGCTAQPVAFLEGIWVEREYRWQGIGRALIEKISNDLLIQGYAELCSDTDIENTLSQHAHGSWGFEETERVVYFRKSLK